MLKNKYVAVLVGLLCVLVLAYNIRYFAGKKSTAPVVSPAARSAAMPVVREGKKDFKRLSVQQDKGQWKRDPFELAAVRPGRTVPDAPGEDIHLMGILKRDGRSHVLINGKVYGENDRIADAVIKKINKHSIVIARGSQQKELYFADYKVLKEKAK